MKETQSKEANISGATSCLMISTKIEGPIHGSISPTWELYKNETAETWDASFVSSINPAKGALWKAIRDRDNLFYVVLDPPRSISRLLGDSINTCFKVALQHSLRNLILHCQLNSPQQGFGFSLERDDGINLLEPAKTTIPLQSPTTEMEEKLIPIAASQLNLNQSLPGAEP